MADSATILLVDDEESVQKLLTYPLERDGYRVVQARDGDEALVIFSGHDAYITPAFYPSKTRDGKVVPTWNYVAVHAYGTLRFVSDPTLLRRHLEALTSHHESSRAQPWAVSDAPESYIDRMLGAIVGVEIEITRLEGKWKMSQNRSAEDVEGVIAGLEASEDAATREVAQVVRARRPG